MEWFIGQLTDNEIIIKDASEEGRLDILILAETDFAGEYSKSIRKILLKAAAMGYKHIISWITEKYAVLLLGHEFYVALLSTAAAGGHVHLFSWMVEQFGGAPGVIETAAGAAAGRGKVLILKNLLSGNLINLRSQGRYLLYRSLTYGSLCGYMAADWIHKTEPTILQELTQTYNLYRFNNYCDSAMDKWLFDNVRQMDCEMYGSDNSEWWRSQSRGRQYRLLALMLSGKRKGLRLPPELWENHIIPLLCGITN